MKKYYLLFLLIRLIIIIMIILMIASPIFYLSCVFFLDMINSIKFNWKEILYKFPFKNFAIDSILGGLAAWIMFIINYIRTTNLGILALRTLRKNGYKAKINEISPDPKVPFYKIDDKLFYNFTLYNLSLDFLSYRIKKIIKYETFKNIVINNTQVSVNIKKLEKKIMKKYGDKINNILIIDKSGKVIKLK